MCSASANWHKMFIELLKWKRGRWPVVCVFLPSISQRSHNKCFLLVLCIIIGTLRKWILLLPWLFDPILLPLTLVSKSSSTAGATEMTPGVAQYEKRHWQRDSQKIWYQNTEMVAFTSTSARCDCCGQSPVTYWNKVGRLKALGPPTDRLSKIPVRATCNVSRPKPNLASSR